TRNARITGLLGILWRQKYMGKVDTRSWSASAGSRCLGNISCSKVNLSVGQHKRQSSCALSILTGSSSTVLHTAYPFSSHFCIDSSCESRAHTSLGTVV